MIVRPLAAVIGLFLLGFAVPTIAQDPISEIKARIADKGQATVLVRMDVAESASLAEPAREGAAVQSDTTPRDRLNRVREGIASRRSSLESSMAAHGIKMQRTYENLPFFVTTVDEAGIEILLRDPGVTSVTLNRARRVNLSLIHI